MGIRQIHIAKADGAAITQIAANSWSHKLGDRAGKILCRNHGHIVGARHRNRDRCLIWAVEGIFYFIDKTHIAGLTFGQILKIIIRVKAVRTIRRARRSGIEG